MKLAKILTLSALGALNIGLIIPTVITTVNGLSPKESIQEDEPAEDLSGVTAARVINGPKKSVYQEGETPNIDGLMCLVTQNGVKKIAKKNFRLITDRPLEYTDTTIRVAYGEFEFDVPIKVLRFATLLNINRNGSYVVQAEDNRIPVDGYIEADSAWSAAHYDGTNQTTKFVEDWTNTRCNPPSGKSLANVAVGSVLGFKFDVAKTCKINISASMAMYDTLKPSDLISFRLDGELKDDVDTALVLTHLNADDAGAKYFNWQNWSMGTYTVEPGNHIFTITVDNTKLPNLDYFKIVATEMENADHVNINNNGTFSIQAADESIDRSGLKDDGSGKSVVENWSTSGATAVSETSGQSIGHLSSAGGSVITFSLGLSGRANVAMKIYAAHPNNLHCDNIFKTNIDGHKLKSTGDVTLSTSSSSTYWNWTTYEYQAIELTKGSHIVTIELSSSPNLLKYEFVASNYQSGEYGVVTIKNNSTQVLQAESTLLNRTNWSVRADFVQAGREPVENWATSHTTAISENSGVSLCGLTTGCIIEIPFENKGACTVRFQIVCAYPSGYVANNCFSVTIDGEQLEDVDTTTTLGSAGSANSGEQYWNWKVWGGGTRSIQAGEHLVRLVVDTSVNIDSFRFVSTSYGA